MRPAGEQPREFHVTANGVDLALVEWAGDGAPILLIHATGFHGRIWDEVARRLPGRRILAVDTRGHGRSAKPEPPYLWDDAGADILDLARVLDLRAVVAVGHSLGGHSAVYAAAREPSRFAGLLLIDPTIGRNASTPREAAEASNSGVARRRNEWASPEEMVERFRDRFPFDLWQPQVLDDYVRYGLLPAPSGEGYVLACPRPSRRPSTARAASARTSGSPSRRSRPPSASCEPASPSPASRPAASRPPPPRPTSPRPFQTGRTACSPTSPTSSRCRRLNWWRKKSPDSPGGCAPDPPRKVRQDGLTFRHGLRSIARRTARPLHR